jgi:hypothetical protein
MQIVLQQQSEAAVLESSEEFHGVPGVMEFLSVTKQQQQYAYCCSDVVVKRITPEP